MWGTKRYVLKRDVGHQPLALSESSTDELPDVANSRERESRFLLFRDADGTSPSQFKWRGYDKDPDGLTVWERPLLNKDFAFGFMANSRGPKKIHSLAGFVEPELFGIAAQYTPDHGGDGHWSVIVSPETSVEISEKFSMAAKRIKEQKIPGQFVQN